MADGLLEPRAAQSLHEDQARMYLPPQPSRLQQQRF
jgi:hypothetical protein